MGGSSSKVARKLPTKAKPSWAGVRSEGAQPARPSPVMASEVKDKAIEMDARDPHFMQKLNQLGPVKVDHHMATVRTDERMRRILQSRKNSEQEAASHTPTRNRLLAGELAELLERRKSAKSRNELANLADQYSVDVDVLDRLAKMVNTPTVLEGSRSKVVGDDGQERITMLAGWEDPPLTKSPTRK